MKIVLWLGVIALLSGIILFFLSGSSSSSGPTVKAIYGTNQLNWMGLALVGLILAIIGITAIVSRRK